MVKKMTSVRIFSVILLVCLTQNKLTGSNKIINNTITILRNKPQEVTRINITDAPVNQTSHCNINSATKSNVTILEKIGLVNTSTDFDNGNFSILQSHTITTTTVLNNTRFSINNTGDISDNVVNSEEFIKHLPNSNNTGNIIGRIPDKKGRKEGNISVVNTFNLNDTKQQITTETSLSTIHSEELIQQLPILNDTNINSETPKKNKGNKRKPNITQFSPDNDSKLAIEIVGEFAGQINSDNKKEKHHKSNITIFSPNKNSNLTIEIVGEFAGHINSTNTTSNSGRTKKKKGNSNQTIILGIDDDLIGSFYNEYCSTNVPVVDQVTCDEESLIEEFLIFPSTIPE